MNDKELLELAANAAGIELDWDIPHNSKNPWRMTGTKGCDDYGPASEWNPLTDDGDSLRLAVKLQITPHIDDNLTDAESTEGFSTEPHFGDPYAATRRAIVRAAAEIGKKCRPASTDFRKGC